MKNYWLDRSLAELYCHYTLCTTEKQFFKVCKRLKLPKNIWPDFVKGGSSATVHEFVNHKTGDKAVAVCIGNTEGKSTSQVNALLVHEAVHIYQWHKENSGEIAPSRECEAYAIQSIAQNLMCEYERQTK